MSSETQENDGAWKGIGSTRIEQVVEALIFAADEPVTARRIGDIYAEVTGEDRVSSEDVEDAARSLNERYAAEDRPLRIEKWGGGFRMATVPEIAPFVKALFQQQQKRRLSRSLMETLAILAYRQPVTKPEVDFVRGVDSDYALRRLLELGLADVVGRSESIGRPLLYGTTGGFLELFGLDGLSDLPNMREIESILNDPAFQKERARLLAKGEILAPANPESGAGPFAGEDPISGDKPAPPDLLATSEPSAPEGHESTSDEQPL